MEQFQKPDCKYYPNNELNMHCPVHNYMVCFTCIRDTHKTCFENEDLRQNQKRNWTVENIMSKTKDLLDEKINMLLELDEWKITVKKEIESFRKRINTHLDQIQSRSEETVENLFKQEQQMHRNSLLDIEEIKRRGANMQAKSNDVNENNEFLAEIKECLEHLRFEKSTQRRPTISRDMKAILEVVEAISAGKIDLNSDVIKIYFSNTAEIVTKKRQGQSTKRFSKFLEHFEATDDTNKQDYDEERGSTDFEGYEATDGTNKQDNDEERGSTDLEGYEDTDDEQSTDDASYYGSEIWIH